MAQQITVYQAADGSIHETEDAARRHDARNAIADQAAVFAQENIKTRNISRTRAERLIAEFALQLLYPASKSDETRPEGQGDDPPGASDFPDIDE